MLPPTTHSLDKLEALLKALNCRVRYEKGNFKTGACMLQDSRIVVVNRFLNTEGRIQALLSLLKQMDADTTLLEEKQKQFLYTIKQTRLTF
jgi:hypothetical protein